VVAGSLWRARQARIATTYGSSRWARVSEIRRANLLKPAGCILGRMKHHYLRHDGPEHVMAFAPTRSGKGVGLVVPTLLSWTGSVVVHDIKGENWQLTAGWRQLFSHCLLFNPTDLRSVRYNPLLEVRKGPDEVRDVQNIADILVDPEGALERRNHWEKTSHSLLVGTILHVLYAEEEKTLAKVASLLSDPQRSFAYNHPALPRIRLRLHAALTSRGSILIPMDDLNVIDRFLDTFLRYIDSGFGLLSGEVAFLTTILIGIDITLAGLFWALEEGPLVGRLLRKVLYVGAFAFILGNFRFLAEVIYQSFAGLGLEVSRNNIAAGDLLKPGRLAGVGFEASWPLLKQAGDLVTVTGFFENFLTIAVLLIAWLVVIAAFFLLAVQLFITILEFKLTSLAGFVLVPFALWNKTSFLAERVLGNVIASGIKVMVLAVIVGIGAGFFQDFIDALRGRDPTLNQAMSLVLASLSLFGFGIFGPGIAAGLVSGAPQLAAGAAMSAAGAAAGTALIAGGGALAAARLGAATSQGAMNTISSTTGALAARAAAAPAAAAAVSASSGTSPAIVGQASSLAGGSPGASSATRPPAWAEALKRDQKRQARAQATSEALKSGDQALSEANPDLEEKD
jgi:type IV secretion system protein TrbL